MTAVQTGPQPKGALAGHLRQVVRTGQLCSPGDTLIVGVSGGADSVALLHLLHTLPDFPLTLVVAHLNHCLRGAESDADELFVQQLAQQLGLPFETRRVAIAQTAAATGCSLEESGRAERYAFFEHLRTRYQATAIAVAHHLDDQAETLLMRLVRGSGTTGLSAMVAVSSRAVIRPLLKVSRQELRDYLALEGLPFREDRSNNDQHYLRNRIRHQLLPLLADYNPAIAGQLAATAERLQEDEALLNDYTRSHYQKLASPGPGWISFPRAELRRLRSGLRTRLYRMAIAHLQGDLHRIERAHLLLLDHCLLKERTGSSLDLPRSLVGLLTADNLLLGLRHKLYPAPPDSCSIPDCGRYDLGNGLSLLIASAPAPANWHDLPAAVTYVDAAAAPFPWQVRPVQAGDRMEPLGMHGSRQTQDILTDRKIPRSIRPALPLLWCNSRPLWLAGACRSRHALLQPGHQSGLRITLLGLEQLPLVV